MPAAPPASRLAVGVVGAGRVGAVLGAALRRAGHRVVAVSGVSDASLRRAEAMLPGVPVEPVDLVARRADLLLLAVPDDALEPLVADLAGSGAARAGQLVAHTSGRHGIAVLAPMVRAGALPLALHPVLTFAGTPVDLERLAGVSFGVTSPDVLRPVAEALVVEMGAEPVWVPEAARVLYHAALSYGANNLATLTATTVDLLRRAGVDAPQRMLGPLLGAAFDNALRHGDAALTGPVARGDAGTVAAHLAGLATTAPELVASYVALARLTADRALAAGLLSAEDAAQLLDTLATRTGAAR